MNLKFMARPSHKGSAHGILWNSMHVAEVSKMNDKSWMCTVISVPRQLTRGARHPAHTSHAEPMQALLIVLSCRDSRYRDWSLLCEYGRDSGISPSKICFAFQMLYAQA